MNAIAADLGRTEECFRRALDAVSEGMWDWNLQTDEVFYSDSFIQMLGYVREEVEPHVRTWQKWLHPDDHQRAIIEVLKLTDGGELGPYLSEHRLRTKCGDWKWILDRGQVIECDGQGRSLRAIGVHTDISRRQLASRSRIARH